MKSKVLGKNIKLLIGLIYKIAINKICKKYNPRLEPCDCITFLHHGAQ
jgi:hypothetical protein